MNEVIVIICLGLLLLTMGVGIVAIVAAILRELQNMNAELIKANIRRSIDNFIMEESDNDD